MAERQLIVAVEGTAAMSPYWQSILSDYLEKIIRSFCSNESAGQKNSPSNVELSLITLNAHGSYWAFLVQRSGWTKDVDIFLQWLSALTFSGGGFNDAAIAEGLSEALMMFPIVANGNQSHQIVDGKRHCILVAASNPYPLPTPVYRPQTQNLEQRENAESQIESRLSDAETVAKSFPQCSVSLSVICPKQLSKLKAIYMAGKRNPSAPDPPFGNVRNSQFLVLISENFMEGRAALSLPGVPSLAPNQSLVKMDMAPATSVAEMPPTSVPSGAVRGTTQVPENSSLNPFASATSNVAGSSNIGISQQMGNVQGAVSMGRSVPCSMSQGNLAGAQLVQIGVGMIQSMSGLGPSNFSSGTSATIPTPGMSQPVQSGMQTHGVNNSSSASSKYIKVWEGNLCGPRHGMPVFITRLEICNTLATNHDHN
ncbi:mediator of RNA polymerase II transcription subunit 25-like isoform X2 [Hibiscus syriacus]|uniref:mediator of RNA polymerase II transcription subunit 25-like isoform X2 n=1 Tax=Hibiscus syriacus TaxID=106335 RepID=UPI0019205F92|nr:mediator of RNA polymerase II transcription subunit 25-like isoform X2 [Hibiscus syriacus]